MPAYRKPLMVAAAVAALVGGGAWAAASQTHHLNVRLPDGRIVQVAYVGDVPPRVVFRPVAAPDPVALGFPGFGEIGRMFQDMQREQAAMMQQVAAMQRAGAAPGVAGNAGGHGASWSYVSSTSTSDGCTRTVQWTSSGDAAHAQPHVVRTSAGNCDKAVTDPPLHQVAQVQAPAKMLPGKRI